MTFFDWFFIFGSHAKLQFFLKSTVRVYYSCLLYMVNMKKIVWRMVELFKKFGICINSKNPLQNLAFFHFEVIHANVSQNAKTRFFSNWTNINDPCTECLYYKIEKIVWRFFKFYSFKHSFIFLFAYVKFNITLHSQLRFSSFLLIIHRKKFAKQLAYFADILN